MYYVLIQTAASNLLYQEIERGVIVRYCDMDGNTVEVEGASSIVSANPPQPSWARPDREITVTMSRSITKTQFRNRFTSAEKIAIYQEANTNVSIKIWLDDLICAESVDLESVTTTEALDGLVQLGLITEQRKVEILNA